MRRRDFVLGTAASLTAGLACRAPWVWASRKSAGAPSRPNILMVSIDDMKPWVGPHGVPLAKTPTFDRFADKGLIFSRAYCAAPACSPSRAAVFTGLAPYQTGTYHNGDNWLRKSPNALTFPRLLKESGYHTSGFGKLFHVPSHDDDEAWNYRRHYSLHKMPNAPLNAPKSIYQRSGSRFDWAALDIDVEVMDDHKQVNRAVKAMERGGGDKPWFVCVGLFRPHLPWYAPKRFFDLHPLDEVPLPVMKPGDLDDVPAQGRRWAKTVEHEIIRDAGLWREAVQAYLASISYIDYELGRLLEKTPSDTTIMIWSDHGWHLGPKTHWHKYSLWEDAAQTVLAMSGPGIAKGAMCPRTVSLNDIYPTICEMSSTSGPENLVGRSLTPLLEDPRAPWKRPAITTWHPNNHAVRSERYRYIRYHDGAEELYDHASDPHEWKNLAGSERHKAIIDAHKLWLPKGRDASEAEAWLEVAEGRRALQPFEAMQPE